MIKRQNIYHLTKALLRNKGVLTKYYTEKTHPAIIDAETFKNAQDIMAENRDRYEGEMEAAQSPLPQKLSAVNAGRRINVRHGMVIFH